MKELTFDYVKPELLDFNFTGAKGAPPSCYVDCIVGDSACPGEVDEIGGDD